MAKVRSTDPKFRHPVDPELLRVPTPVEHARCKGIPAKLIEGLSKTIAHEGLGQSVIYPKFVAVGKLIAQCIRAVKFAVAPVEEFKLAA